MSDWCRACGHGTEVKMVERKDVHGHIVGFFEYSNCDNCGLMKVITPWMETPCPTPRKSSNC
jgi:hypothetical protein